MKENETVLQAWQVALIGATIAGAVIAASNADKYFPAPNQTAPITAPKAKP